jgi:hypothetical protein
VFAVVCADVVLVALYGLEVVSYLDEIQATDRQRTDNAGDRLDVSSEVGAEMAAHGH